MKPMDLLTWPQMAWFLVLVLIIIGVLAIFCLKMEMKLGKVKEAKNIIFLKLFTPG